MIIAASTFIVVLSVMLTTYWWLLVRPEAAAHSELQRRLTPSVVARAAASPLIKSEVSLSAIPWLDRALREAGRLIGPIQRLITLAGYSFTPGALVLACACSGSLLFLAASTGLHLGWLALLFGLLGAWMPIAFLRWRATRRLLLFEEQFPEAIDLIARALRAGHAFTTGLSMVGDEAPQPVAGEFKRLYEEQNFGRPMPEALRALAERVPLLDARFFVTAVLTQREAGGNLAEVLDNLSTVIRDRFKVKRQIRVVTAHARMTGWVLICEPPLLAAIIMFTTPGHLKKFSADPIGLWLIGGALVLQVVGTLIIRKLVNIQY